MNHLLEKIHAVGHCGKIANWCDPDFQDDLCIGCPINIQDDEY